jgi:hypothetical protein
MKLFVISSIVLALLAIDARAARILKREPEDHSLRGGKVVYVDDGTCPPGQIKMVVGGRADKGIRRKRNCVRPPR